MADKNAMQKTAIVTGAGRGIGYETALLLAKKYNCKVVALTRSESALRQLAAAAPQDAIIPLSFDLAEGNYIKLNDFLSSNKITAVDLLINNAGALVNKPFEQITADDLQRCYSVNVFAPYLLIQNLLPLLKSAELSHVVNISSMGGFQGVQKFPGLSAYSSSKGALVSVTECLAEELKDTNVRINCLCLGSVQTEMLAEAFPGYKAPLTAVEMGDFVAHFGLHNHRFMHGKIVPVALSTP